MAKKTPSHSRKAPAPQSRKAALRNGESNRPFKRSSDVASPRSPLTGNERVGQPSRNKIETDDTFKRWCRKYRAVESAILAERNRRAESKRRRAHKAFGCLCEMTEGRASFCRRYGLSMEEAATILDRKRPIHPSLWPFYAMGELAWFALNALRKELTRRIDRANHELKRPLYYRQERARRQALAAERRKLNMRHTLNPCPTKEQILDAWIHVKDSPAALLRFGSLLEDLECYVDNSLRKTDDGIIIGRRPGIKGWLQMNIPALHLKYSTVMAHKAVAKRMRQIVDLRDPIPLSTILPPLNADSASKDHTAKASGATKRCKNKRLAPTSRQQDRFKDYGADEIFGQLCGADEIDVLRAIAVYREVMKPVGDGRRKQNSLTQRLMALTDPDMVEDANMLQQWKAHYEDKITVRTKSIWETRLRWTG